VSLYVCKCACVCGGCTRVYVCVCVCVCVSLYVFKCAWVCVSTPAASWNKADVYTCMHAHVCVCVGGSWTMLQVGVYV
jgi:hypothetical protein